MLGECGEAEACGARTAARNRYEEAHFNWRTCSHSMRAQRTVSSSSLSDRCHLLVGEEHLLA